MGASGDLARKKIFPALFALFQRRRLPISTTIVGVARSKTVGDLWIRSCLSDIDQEFLSMCTYQSIPSYSDWRALRQVLTQQERLLRGVNALDRPHGQDSTERPLHLRFNLLVYFAIPPSEFAATTSALRIALLGTSVGLRRPDSVSAKTLAAIVTRPKRNEAEGRFVRIVLEKPFGRDTDSCRSLLNTLTKQQWPESSIFRVDHYLGKDMVANLVFMRQANSSWLDQQLWNRNAIEAVHIVLKESFGTSGRGGYFDSYGIIRDVIQNHLLQLLSIVCMDLPSLQEASTASVDREESIRDAKVRALQRISSVRSSHALLGQYVGYADDETISNKSTATPTYAAICCYVQGNPRWDKVPFILEAGKALDESLCEVRLHFRSHESCLPRNLAERSRFPPTMLVIRIQPNPAMYFSANVKTPGLKADALSTHWVITYDEKLCGKAASRSGMNCVSGARVQRPGEQRGPPLLDAYSRLLVDVLHGSTSSFVRDDELLEAWRIFTPLLHHLDDNPSPPVPYASGTAGPASRQDFLQSMGLPMQAQQRSTL
jgi:glucose-6-phosphate 1-dehydrogenase